MCAGAGVIADTSPHNENAERPTSLRELGCLVYLIGSRNTATSDKVLIDREATFGLDAALIPLKNKRKTFSHFPSCITYYFRLH